MDGNWEWRWGVACAPRHSRAVALRVTAGCEAQVVKPKGARSIRVPQVKGKTERTNDMNPCRCLVTMSPVDGLRQALGRRGAPVRVTPPSPGLRGRPTRSRRTHAQRDNPDGVHGQPW